MASWDIHIFLLHQQAEWEHKQLPHALLNAHPVTLPNPPSLIECIRVGIGALPFTLKTGQHQRKTSAQPCLAGDQLIVENLLQIHKGVSL